MTIILLLAYAFVKHFNIRIVLLAISYIVHKLYLNIIIITSGLYNLLLPFLEKQPLVNTTKRIMKRKDYTGIIPPQCTGTEIEVDASVELKNINEAKTFYKIAKSRLLQVNNWHHVAGIISAKFQLIDATGSKVERNAAKNDYLKIDIPGPGSTEGDGYDWVLVEALNEVSDGENESIGFRVRPCKNPFGKKNEIAHFYADEATSNFIVIREGTNVIAWVVDHNLIPNDHAEFLVDKLRDTTIGMGAISLFSKIQWQGLSDGIIKQ